MATPPMDPQPGPVNPTTAAADPAAPWAPVGAAWEPYPEERPAAAPGLEWHVDMQTGATLARWPPPADAA